MKNVFSIVVLLFVCTVAKAQKLNLGDLVNAIYKDQVKAENIDTVIFLNTCESKFFVAGLDKHRAIKFISFSSKESFDDYIKMRKECFVFKASILEVGSNTMNLQVGLYKSSYSDISKEGNFFVFVDERTVSCLLSGESWILNKTIKTEDY
jgi:hypothetical protein